MRKQIKVAIDIKNTIKLLKFNRNYLTILKFG